jgi:hypothetical protein
MREEQSPQESFWSRTGIDGCVDATLREVLAPTEYALMHVRKAVEAVATLELLKSEITLAIIESNFRAANGFDLIG